MCSAVLAYVSNAEECWRFWTWWWSQEGAEGALSSKSANAGHGNFNDRSKTYMNSLVHSFIQPLLTQILGWPRSLFRFPCNILEKPKWSCLGEKTGDYNLLHQLQSTSHLMGQLRICQKISTVVTVIPGWEPDWADHVVLSLRGQPAITWQWTNHWLSASSLIKWRVGIGFKPRSQPQTPSHQAKGLQMCFIKG